MKGRLAAGILALAVGLMPGGAIEAEIVSPGDGGRPTVKLGDRLPDVLLSGKDGTTVRLGDLQGRVKLISIVPQLNTPVCDEQTHHFSEQNGGLDQKLAFITLSTNTADDQAVFARKAHISNMTFLSDAPSYEFGRRTGLLGPFYKILHRSVIVADAKNMIRYMQLVPMGELPNFDAALDAARQLASGRGENRGGGS